MLVIMSCIFKPETTGKVEGHFGYFCSHCISALWTGIVFQPLDVHWVGTEVAGSGSLVCKNNCVCRATLLKVAIIVFQTQRR